MLYSVYYNCKEKKRKEGVFMLKLNENPVELNRKKWVFYGGVYQHGSLSGSLGILAAGPRGGHAVMITENLFNYGKPTVGGYIALNQELRRKKRYLGMTELVKQMFCENEESYLDMRDGYRTLLRLKPEVEKMIRDDNVKGGSKK